MPTVKPASADKIIRDAAYSWWIHPLAVQDSAGRNWVGSISKTGEVFVTVDGLRISIDQVEPDDHNAPAIAVHETNPDRPAVVFNSAHHKEPRVRYRKVNPNGTLGPQRVLEHPYPVTYAQALVSGNTIAIFVRSSLCRWYVSTSLDWGDNWSSPIEFLNGCAQGQHTYMTTGPHPTAGTHRIAVYGHPTQSSWDTIEYGYLKLDSGQVLVPGGAQVGNIYTGNGLPILKGNLAVAYAPKNNMRCRLFDISTVAGLPMIAFAEWDEFVTGHGPIRYRTVRYENGGWIATDVGRYAGPPIFETSRYASGAGFGADGNLFTTSVERGLEQWAWTGVKWELVEGIVSGLTVGRPYGIRRSSTGLIWQTILNYPSFADYDIDTNVRY